VGDGSTPMVPINFSFLQAASPHIVLPLSSCIGYINVQMGRHEHDPNKHGTRRARHEGGSCWHFLSMNFIPHIYWKKD
jgi:hypothetical protein